MGEKLPKFADLMACAFHVVRVLDRGPNSRSSAAAVRDSRRVYSQLLEYRKTTKMTLAQGALVQRALDLIWARLRTLKAS
ncbi:MAG TPA: hypothetical protein VME68_03145 [Acidobacteriaceae bacterium]|nr:hypothetical protein [Acidobacteriaceae bacterium]